MISDKMYLEAEEAGVIIDCTVKLPETKSVSLNIDEHMFIGIDDKVMQNRAEERVHLPLSRTIRRHKLVYRTAEQL